MCCQSTRSNADYLLIGHTVQWNDCVSNTLPVGSGWLQGSALSPVLFNVFIDLFIRRLKLNYESCHIDDTFYGCFLYADEIIILSLSVHGLQVMLDTCSTTSCLLSLDFNTVKSHSIMFGKFKGRGIGQYRIIV